MYTCAPTCVRGSAQANSAPAGTTTTATMANTGTNAAAAASTSGQAPKPGAKRGRKDEEPEVSQYIQLEPAMYTCAPTCIRGVAPSLRCRVRSLTSWQ
jgi:hypothetical protein